MVNLKFCLFLAFALQVKAEESRIIGGKPALQSSYPFVVSFQNFTEDEFLWMKSPRYQHFCAGTILDATRILTAAHCIKDISDYRNVSIYAGVTNLQDTNGQRRFIKGCVPYSEYKSGKDFGNNDVAVCRLSSRLVQDNPTNLQANNGSRVTFVTLDDSNAAVQKPGTMCRVVGWGSVSMISLGSLTFVNDLQAINLPILEHSKCAAMWPKATLSNNTQVCTQDVATRGACSGDSGGPLMCPNAAGDKWVQVGIIAAGNQVCATGQPDVYTRIANGTIRDFINSPPNLPGE